jgi:hypothetical protein
MTVGQMQTQKDDGHDQDHVDEVDGEDKRNENFRLGRVVTGYYLF